MTFVPALERVIPVHRHRLAWAAQKITFPKADELNQCCAGGQATGNGLQICSVELLLQGHLRDLASAIRLQPRLLSAPLCKLLLVGAQGFFLRPVWSGQNLLSDPCPESTKLAEYRQIGRASCRERV